jgi:hypothetical protein
MLKLYILALCLLVLTGCSTPVADPGPQIEQNAVRQPVDFSGSWEMDYRLSEDSERKIRWKVMEALAIERRQQATGESYARNRNIGPVVSLGDQKPGRLAEGVLALGRLVEKASRSPVFTIRQNDREVVIERQDEFSLTCSLEDDPEGNLATTMPIGQERCFWSGDQLVFDVGLPEGLSMRYVLTQSARGNRLNVSTTAYHKDAGEPFTLDRVYTPFEPGQGMYECEFTLTTLKTCRMGTDELRTQ